MFPVKNYMLVNGFKLFLLLDSKPFITRFLVLLIRNAFAVRYVLVCGQKGREQWHAVPFRDSKNLFASKSIHFAATQIFIKVFLWEQSLYDVPLLKAQHRWYSQGAKVPSHCTEFICTDHCNALGQSPELCDPPKVQMQTLPICT